MRPSVQTAPFMGTPHVRQSAPRVATHLIPHGYRQSYCQTHFTGGQTGSGRVSSLHKVTQLWQVTIFKTHCPSASLPLSSALKSCGNLGTHPESYLFNPFLLLLEKVTLKQRGGRQETFVSILHFPLFPSTSGSSLFTAPTGSQRPAWKCVSHLL